MSMSADNEPDRDSLTTKCLKGVPTPIVSSTFRHHPLICNRSELVRSMIQMHLQLKLHQHALFLSVKLFDLFLDVSRSITEDEMKLASVAAMLIANNNSEQSEQLKVDEFVSWTGDSSKENLERMAKRILGTLSDFEMDMLLADSYLIRYAECVPADKPFLALASFVLESTLEQRTFSQIQDSTVACAALFYAMRMADIYQRNFQNEDNKDTQPIVNMFGKTTEWNYRLIECTGMIMPDFFQHMACMGVVFKAQVSSKGVVFEKYSHKDFYEVAKIEPLTRDEMKKHWEITCDTEDHRQRIQMLNDRFRLKNKSP